MLLCSASKIFFPFLAIALTSCVLDPAGMGKPSLAKRAAAEGHTRSISNSGYGVAHNAGMAANPLFRGELTEADVFGAGPQPAVNSNEDPATATHRPQRGDRLVLVQSGVPLPDELMLNEAAHYFNAATSSGVPPPAGSGLGADVRQHAIEGGYRFVVFYWGVIDFSPEPIQMHTVALEPIPAPAMPEQKQQMSIRLTALVLNVANGEWTKVTPEPYYVTRYSSGWSLKASDQKLVRTLKVEGFRSLLAALVRQ